MNHRRASSNNVETLNDWTRDAGPLRIPLNDPYVTEIMVNSHDRVFIEKNGMITESQTHFKNEQMLITMINSLLIAVGKELNVKNPFVDARLPDGSRLNAVIPPVSVKGPCLTIRKFLPQVLTPRHLLDKKALDEKVLYFLKQAVIARQNIVVSGGTGSGKTTLLNVICSFIPKRERVITIEDTAELNLPNRNLVSLEARENRIEDLRVSIDDLLRNALRMRPNRIIVGECRGAEAWDMLLAMNTGHEGSMTSVHSNSARDALRRIEAMIMRSGLEASTEVIQRDVGETVDIVIQTERASDGQRRITEICDVLGHNHEGYITKEIFYYDYDKNQPQSTGEVPRFVDSSRHLGVQLPENFFDPQVKISLSV